MTDDSDLIRCRGELEAQILRLESRTLEHTLKIEGTVQRLEAAIHALRGEIETKVPMPRFRPVEVFSWGMMSGIGLFVLAMVLNRTVGGGT